MFLTCKARQNSFVRMKIEFCRNRSVSEDSVEKREIYNLNRDDTVVAVVGAVDNVEKQNYQ